MSRSLKRTAVIAAMAVIGLATSRTMVQTQSRVSTIAAVSAGDLRTWDGAVTTMVRAGELTMRLERADTLVPGRTHERYAQLYRGVPVYGGDLARQVDDKGLTISIFGSLYEGIAIDTEPKLTSSEAQAVVERDSGVQLGPERTPRLVILPGNQRSTLVYQARAATLEDIYVYFIDAKTGAIVEKRSDVHTQQSAVGLGNGVLGDRKKIVASPSGGAFVASDLLRPPLINTYDMQGNLGKVLGVLNGVQNANDADLATDTDNEWTDGANVDAHTYAGYTYDYYFKRFGRRGLDNANLKMRSIVHPVRRNDLLNYSSGTVSLFFLNAFYSGDGLMVYGEGLPPGFVLGGTRQSVNFFAGAIDVVAHELSHGVTDYTSQLIYSGESGALNEAFSDMMGTSVEYFFQTPGSGALHADYLIGEDIITPGGIRSMSDPATFGDPDHYTRRYTGTGDNGGVHINSAIANQAFYLSIEGGTNRTSGLQVQGVGGDNREQIEKVFYRAFTQLMPANATFATARAATIQAARDLYGASSAAERAVTQAWTAVGVN
jgi:thermolysin